MDAGKVITPLSGARAGIAPRTARPTIWEPTCRFRSGSTSSGPFPKGGLILRAEGNPPLTSPQSGRESLRRGLQQTTASWWSHPTPPRVEVTDCFFLAGDPPWGVVVGRNFPKWVFSECFFSCLFVQFLFCHYSFFIQVFSLASYLSGLGAGL